MIGADSILASTAGNAALISFALYMVVVFVLAGLANREQSGKSFLNEYFLGEPQSRHVGVCLYLRGHQRFGRQLHGSLTYLHGWVMALWIGVHRAAGCDRPYRQAPESSGPQER